MDKYANGMWGSGSYNSKQLAEKYGLDNSNPGRGDEHVWGRNADGSEVYIGKTNMELASNSDLIKSHSKQADSGEINHSDKGDKYLSSSGDIKGAILNQFQSGSAPAAAQKEEEEEPIQLSETVATAIGRAKAYQDTLAIRDGDYTIGGDESVLDDFRTQSEANIAEAMKPGYYDGKLKLQKTV
tara:strand:- start:681 stop:1232 length:552 start_codon:yes stop_codon:yes gene_type:complete